MVRGVVLAVVLVALSACHRVTYTTPRTPGPTTTVWNHFFVLGLFGHARIDTRAMCPDGVARIVAYQHVHHILLTVVTVGIYAPRSVQITCAASNGPGPTAAREKTPR